MWAEQAIFTSLTRSGKAGYHLVARSSGLSDSDATTLVTWSPSHGALIVDASNRVSVNFHPMPEGRFALSRTCEGPAEYSGRGGRQVYTHALVFDQAALRQARHRVFALYRDALALGHLHYRPAPESILKPAALLSAHPATEPIDWDGRARALGLPPLDRFRARLGAGEDLVIPHAGDRAALAECLIGPLAPEQVTALSFSTSLRASAVRPFHLILVGPEA